MNIGILGTGIVGQTLGSHLIKRSHKVMLGSRSVDNELAKKWAVENNAVNNTFNEAAAFGDIVLIVRWGFIRWQH